MKYKYYFKFIDGTILTFETTINIDFHAINNSNVAFDDIYINMANVIYITKGGAE